MKNVVIAHTKLTNYRDLGVYPLKALLLLGLLNQYTPTLLRGEPALAGLVCLVILSLIECAMYRFEFHGLEPFQSPRAECHHSPAVNDGATLAWWECALVTSCVR
jgi:hypothetical protein